MIPEGRSTVRLLDLPLSIVPAGEELSELAGELKVVKKMSLADCFAAALGKRTKAEHTPEIPSPRRSSEKSNSFGPRSSCRSK
jgi:hypothetical protein